MTITEKKYILAIDHGTNGPKAAIVSTHGDVLDWAFQVVPIHATKGGGVEQDPDDWWNAIVKTAKNVIDKIGAGMKKKVFGALEALEGKLVKEVIIASGLVDFPISQALEHKGTVIS